MATLSGFTGASCSWRASPDHVWTRKSQGRNEVQNRRHHDFQRSLNEHVEFSSLKSRATRSASDARWLPSIGSNLAVSCSTPRQQGVGSSWGRRRVASVQTKAVSERGSSAPSSKTSPSPSPSTAALASPASPAAAAAGDAPRVFQQNPLDTIFLNLFRQRMFEQIRWKSTKPDYEGLVEEARVLLTKYKTKQESEETAIVILRTMFPSIVLPLFKDFIAPFQNGRPAAILTAQVTKFTCQWLMGPSDVVEIDMPDGTKLASGVKVEKCRFLEETKCAGSCIHTCKIPTQRFMIEDMGVPLHMEPNYEDFSCQFKFGIPAPAREDDEILRAPCLAICPTAASSGSYRDPAKLSPGAKASSCPQVAT